MENHLVGNDKNTDILGIFGQNIRFAREKRNLTIHELADLAKYNRIILSRLEYGEQNFKLSTAIRLAETMNIPLPELFSRNYINNFGKGSEELQKGFQYDNFLMVFSENVKRRLQSLNKSQVYLYTQTGIDQATVNKLLNQKTANPKITTLDKLAQALDQNLYNLLTRNERS